MAQIHETIYNEVFISYSRKNKEFTQRIVQAIYDSGRKNVWIDWEDIEYAEDWWQKIQAGIESAYNFIFIMSPASMASVIALAYMGLMLLSNHSLLFIPRDCSVLTSALDLLSQALTFMRKIADFILLEHE